MNQLEFIDISRDRTRPPDWLHERRTSPKLKKLVKIKETVEVK